MRKSIYFVALIITQQLTAQQFYFAKENYKDSLTLANTIPALAEKVIPLHKNADKTGYFDDLFRYLIVAKHYDRSIAVLDSLRAAIPPASQSGINGVGVQYETFSRARLAQGDGGRSFEEIYKHLFAETFVRLDGDARNYVETYSTPDVAPLKKNLDNLIAKLGQKDTVTLKEAEQLIRAYNSYVVYSRIVPLMRPVIVAEDNKKFIIDRVYIKTRDGSLVQAEIGRRKDIKQRLPTIFIFNIYIDSAYDVAEVKSYVSKGYACVVANTRGKGGSPQEIDPFEHDADDAYDIIDWISRQPWSNKKVGMTGGSYLGFSQWAAVKNVHPALKTIMPEVAVGTGVDYPMVGNVFMSYMLRWIHYVSNSKKTDEADFNNDSHWDSVNHAWYKRGASFRSFDSVEGRPNAIFQRWLMHPSYDSYWQNMRANAEDFSKINIPILTTTGYFDDDGNGAMYYYREHYRHNPNANNYLVIGPYSHAGAQSYPRAELSGYKVDSVATTFNFINLSVQWFDYVLKDSARPALLQNKVNYEVMGGNEWRHAASLAGMSNDTLTLYLGNTRVNQFYKLNDAPLADEYVRQEVDLADRSDSAAEEEDHKIFGGIPDTKNAISFVSRPVEDGLIVSGSFISSLQAAINKKDMDVSIVMFEQTADGKYFQLGSSVQRASYAKDAGRRQLLEPGRKEAVPVNYSFMTCKKLSKGSRLVVVVGIVKGSDLQINYGSGKDVSDETIADAGVPLEIKWFGDSYIKIPVLR